MPTSPETGRMTHLALAATTRFTGRNREQSAWMGRRGGVREPESSRPAGIREARIGETDPGFVFGSGLADLAYKQKWTSPRKSPN